MHVKGPDMHTQSSKEKKIQENSHTHTILYLEELKYSRTITSCSNKIGPISLSIILIWHAQVTNQHIQVHLVLLLGKKWEIWDFFITPMFDGTLTKSVEPTNNRVCERIKSNLDKIIGSRRLIYYQEGRASGWPTIITKAKV